MGDGDRFPEAYKVACQALSAYMRGEQVMSLSIGGEQLKRVSRGGSDRQCVAWEAGIEAQAGDGVPRPLPMADVLALARGFANRLVRDVRIDGANFEETVWRFQHEPKATA